MAIDGLGHLDAGVMNYDRTGEQDAPRPDAFNSPISIAVDTVAHRLFVVDGLNRRVLVFQLSDTNDFAGVDRVADFVLGKPHLHASDALGATTAANLNEPTGLALDVVGRRLFVCEATNRVLVFDVASITNGEAAVAVLGQTGFTTSAPGTTATTLSRPMALAYDPGTGRLFVADQVNDRVLVYDAATITNGEAAVNVLGQPDFTTNAEASTPNDRNIRFPSGVALDPSGARLFVSDSVAARVLVFDATAIANGMSSQNVLGAPDHVTSGDAAPVSATSLNGPGELWHDAANRLFVTDVDDNRVLVYDTTTLSDGEPATVVLGQPGFTTNDPGQVRFPGDPEPLTTRSTLHAPNGVVVAGTTLFVADATNHRVLLYDAAPGTLASGAGASDGLGHLHEGIMIFDRDERNGGGHADAFTAPAGVALAPGRLYVADRRAARVTVFVLSGANDFSGVDRVADVVVGQVNFAATQDAPTPLAVLPPAVAVLGTRLFVADVGRNRVVVYDSAGLTNGEMPVAYLGQPDGTSSDGGLALNRMREPAGLAVDPAADRLFVADQGNDRVLVFEDASTISTGAQASHTLGWSLAGSLTPLVRPRGLAFDATTRRLWVSEPTKNRVLSFDTASMNDQAVEVLGQTSLSGTGAGTSATTLRAPEGLAHAGSRLYVADTGNHRVLAFDTATVTNGEAAVRVIGQPRFGNATPAAGRTHLRSPSGVTVDPASGRVWVADTGNARVLVFSGP